MLLIRPEGKKIVTRSQQGGNMRSSDVKALVTGGASGIGRAIAGQIVAAGGAVAVLDRPGSTGNEAVTELGEPAAFIPCDITDSDSVPGAVDAAADRLGGLNALVSCAGVSDPTPLLDRAGEVRPLDRFRRVVEVNLVGLYAVLTHAVSWIAREEPDGGGERGVIVNLSSIAAYEGQVGQSAYAASKGAVAALTLPLARELAPRGIRVLTICPGIMDTPMLAGMNETVRESLAALPLFPHRLGDPTEVAELVQSCLEIGYLNGTVLRLDGGVRLPAR